MILAAIVFGSLAWLMIYVPDSPADFAEKVRKQGTNAVPQLLERLRTKDSKFKTKLIELSEKQNLFTFHFQKDWERYNQAVDGFRILGTNAGFAAPALIKIFEENISDDSRNAVWNTLIDLGPPGADAVLSFYDHQGKTNAEYRVWALWLLPKTDLDLQRLLQFLIQSLKDPDTGVRSAATLSLSNLVDERNREPDISSTILALTEALNDPDSRVRDGAAQALRRMELRANVNARARQK